MKMRDHVFVFVFGFCFFLLTGKARWKERYINIWDI